jgi:hypothetical protein
MKATVLGFTHQHGKWAALSNTEYASISIDF